MNETKHEDIDIIFDIRLQKLPIRIYKFDMVVDNEIALLFNNFKYMFLSHWCDGEYRTYCFTMIQYQTIKLRYSVCKYLH